ncbi:hypothetical protein FACS1894199_15310 [Bacteroidia bacterium]|nr:hypothetical protein FACS1894199_15310 [Bacteroidia bacterium]
MYFGVFMILEKQLKRQLDKIPNIINNLYTLLLTIFSWSIFYFTDFSKLTSFVCNLFYSTSEVNPQFYTDLLDHLVWFAVVIILCIPWDEIFSAKSRVYRLSVKGYTYLSPLTNVAILLLSTAMLVGATYNPFIYFRF